MPSRDVEINLVGHDHTGHATRSAGNNLDQLARKLDKFNGKDLGGGKTTNKVVADSKKNFAKAGDEAGKSFASNFRKRMGSLGKEGLRRFGATGFGRAGTRAGTAFASKFRNSLKRVTAPVDRIGQSFLRTGNRAGTAFVSSFRRKLNSLRNLGLRQIGKGNFAGSGLVAGAAFASSFRRKLRSLGRVATSVDAVVARSFGRSGARSGEAFATRFRAKTRILGKAGSRGGAAFLAGFIKTVTFGQVGQGFARSAIRMAPSFATAGATVGAVFAAAIVTTAAQAIIAALPLALAGALLAAPIAFLLKQGSKASKDATEQQKSIAALKKRIATTEAKDPKSKTAKADQQKKLDSLKKELSLQQANLDKLHQQSQQYDRLKLKAKTFMQTISAPLRIPLQDSITEIGKGFDRLTKPLLNVFKALGPALAPFTRGVMDGLVAFVHALEPALPGIVAGFREWGKQMPVIGKALGDMLAKLAGSPKLVVQSIRDIVTVIKDLTIVIPPIITLLGLFGSAWVNFGNAFKVGGDLGGWLASLQSVQGAFVSTLNLLDKFVSAWATISPIMRGPAAAIHNFAVSAAADFAAVVTAKQNMDRKLESSSSKIAGFKNAINVLKAFKAQVDKALKNPNLSKAKRIKLEIDSHHFDAQIAISKARLHALQKTRSKPKLEADKSRLEAVVKSANAQLRKTHNRKTIAKINADKRQAEAALAVVNARLNALNGKTVTSTIKINTVHTFITRSFKGRTVRIKDPGPSAGSSWQGSLSGGDSARTGGPAPINVAAPTVDTRVFIDSREIRAVARSTVLDENRRNAYRARVGARR